MTRLIVLGPALVGLGYLPARLITGSRVWSLLVAPITAALLVGVVGTVGVVLRLSVAFTAVASIALSVAAGIPVLRSLRARRGGGRESWAPLLFPAAGLFPFLTVRRAPVDWDARSIWWFHARWFAAGGAQVADAMRNPVFAFSHPDYPPLAPATNGVLWWLGGTESLKQAQLVTAVLTLSAIATLAFACWYAVRRILPAWVAALAGLVMVAAAYGTSWAGASGTAAATNGYVDALWAAAFAAGCVFVLACRPSPTVLRWGALCLAVAALTKNEGLLAVVLVVGLALARYRFGRLALVWLLGALAPGVTWLAVAHAIGAPSDYRRSAVSKLLRLDPTILDQFHPATAAVWHQMVGIVLATAAVSVLGLVVGRAMRRQLSGTAVPWMWLAWLTTTSVIIVGTVLSPLTHEQLLTAADRTTIASRLVLVAEALLWGATALAALLAPRARRAGVSGPGAGTWIDAAPRPRRPGRGQRTRVTELPCFTIVPAPGISLRTGLPGP